MRLLELLMKEPRGPTRLAQAANLNYQTCADYLGVLSTNGFVSKEVQDGHEIYTATQKGKDIFFRWDRIYEELNLP
jgi:predicted transcriptional regulator